MRKLTDFERWRLEEQRNHFQSEWNIRTAKLAELRKALAIETSVATKFQLEHQIQAEKEAVTRLESQLSQIEQNLNLGTTSSSVPQRSSQSRSPTSRNPAKYSSTAHRASQSRSFSVDPDRIIEVLPKVWIWLLAIIAGWMIMGGLIKLHLDTLNSPNLTPPLLIGGGFGGGLTGLLYGWAKQKLVTSTQLDQIILMSMIGVVLGILSGLLLLTGVANPSALFRGREIGIGMIAGCAIAIAALWRLSLYSQRHN
jgi:hypothetical protein